MTERQGKLRRVEPVLFVSALYANYLAVNRISIEPESLMDDMYDACVAYGWVEDDKLIDSNVPRTLNGMFNFDGASRSLNYVIRFAQETGDYGLGVEMELRAIPFDTALELSRNGIDTSIIDSVAEGSQQ